MGFDGIVFASRALQAQSAALDVVGENLARANTDGYTRQRLIPNVGPSTPLPLTPTNTVGPGGPLFSSDGVERFRDQFLDGAIRTQNTVLGAAQTSQDLFTRANSIFDETSKAGIAKVTSSFFDTVQTVSANPGDLSLRQTLLSQAQSVTESFQQAAGQVVNLSQEAHQRTQSAVDDINKMLQQLAELNQAIPTRGTSEVNRLLDQRDLILDKLAKQMDIQVAPQPQGDLVVYNGGVPVVFGKTARQLSISQDGSGNDVVTTDNGKTLASPGGTLGALLDFHNNGLPAVKAQLDSLATTMMGKVNGILANSYDLNGNAGAPLFTGTSAITMGVGLNSPAQLALAAASLQSTAAINAANKTVDSGQTLASQNPNLATPLSASSGTVIVNGVAVNWTDTESLSQFLASLPAGVVGQFNPTTQKVTLVRDPSAGSGPDVTISDSSGNLAAALGVATATLNKGIPGDAGGANAILAMNSQPVVGSQTLPQAIQGMLTGVATSAGRFGDAASTSQALQTALTAQREQVSGVNTDEEAVNLVQYQRAYEAALRLANAQDSLMDTLINKMGVGG